jgi:hypothetical protein
MVEETRYMVGYRSNDKHNDWYTVLCDLCDNDYNRNLFSIGVFAGYSEAYNEDFNKLKPNIIGTFGWDFGCTCHNSEGWGSYPIQDIYDTEIITKELAIILQPQIENEEGIESAEFIKIGIAYIEEVLDTRNIDADLDTYLDTKHEFTPTFLVESYDLLQPIDPYPSDFTVDYYGKHVIVKCISHSTYEYFYMKLFWKPK